MPLRQFANAPAQSTVSAAITNSQTTVTLLSAAGFPALLQNGQFSVVILDSANPAYNASTPFATPFEYQPVNNITGNVLTFGPGGGSASRAAYAGTTPHAYFAGGATVAAVWLADDVLAAFPTKFDEQTPTSGSSITIPSSGSFPATGFRTIRIKYQIRSGLAALTDPLSMRFNGDSAANYQNEVLSASSGTVASSQNLAQTSLGVGDVTAGNTGTNIPATGRIEIFNYAQATFRKHFIAQSFVNSGGTMKEWVTGGEWTATPVGITSVTLFLGTGPFVTGSVIVAELDP
jgi:hypothetical protein